MYKNILYATDLKEEHYHTSEKAKTIAEKFDATLHMLHVIELPSSVLLAQNLGFAELVTPKKDDAIIVLESLAGALNLPTDNIHVEIGTVSHHIIEKVKELGCDLIIIGSHSTEGMTSFLGSSASATTHHAPCDVLVLKN